MLFKLQSCAVVRRRGYSVVIEVFVFPGEQRIVSPETDSGFGSSYLNQPDGGPFQADQLTERYNTE